VGNGSVVGVSNSVEGVGVMTRIQGFEREGLRRLNGAEDERFALSPLITFDGMSVRVGDLERSLTWRTKAEEIEKEDNR